MWAPVERTAVAGVKTSLLNRLERLVADRPTTTGALYDATRSVGDVLGDHVTFEVECIDRMLGLQW